MLSFSLIMTYVSYLFCTQGHHHHLRSKQWIGTAAVHRDVRAGSPLSVVLNSALLECSALVSAVLAYYHCQARHYCSVISLTELYTSANAADIKGLATHTCNTAARLFTGGPAVALLPACWREIITHRGVLDMPSAIWTAVLS